MYVGIINNFYKDPVKHLDNIESLLPKIHGVGVPLKPKKRYILTTKVEYLGRIITIHKLSTTKTHSKGLKDMSISTWSQSSAHCWICATSINSLWRATPALLPHWTNCSRKANYQNCHRWRSTRPLRLKWWLRPYTTHQFPPFHNRCYPTQPTQTPAIIDLETHSSKLGQMDSVNPLGSDHVAFSPPKEIVPCWEEIPCRSMGTANILSLSTRRTVRRALRPSFASLADGDSRSFQSAHKIESTSQQIYIWHREQERDSHRLSRRAVWTQVPRTYENGTRWGHPNVP